MFTVTYIESQFDYTILQLSDLHLNPSLTDPFLNKILTTVSALQPDLILFTGDFLCRSKIGDKERLKRFLNAFTAPKGCFAILGNHDYAHYVSIHSSGDYDLQEKAFFPKVLSLLKKKVKLTARTTERAKHPPFHPELKEILDQSPFQLLHNETRRIDSLNICGLGDYMAGHFDPEKTFKTYDPTLPGIVLSHNPDTIPHLKKYPGNLILCGHTHGAQVNIPLLRHRLTPLENPQYLRGLKKEGEKMIYINRGVGSTFPFRFFSAPEITLFTRRKK